MDSRDMTGLILSGGRGSRMGGVDKGLQTFNGMPLALNALTRLKAGGVPGPIVINANRNLAAYEAFGVPVWPDSVADYAGPLAGFLAGFERCTTPFLLTVPCDVPLFPLDLAPRLAQTLQASGADIAMVTAPELDSTGQVQLRKQPVFCLLRATLHNSLARYIGEGGRKIDAWTALQRTVLVPFDAPGDDPKAFFNANTLAELRRLEVTPT